MIYFEQGTEHWLPEAKRFLERLEKIRAMTGAQSLSRAMVPEDGVLIWAKVSSLRKDVRITGNPFKGRFYFGADTHRIFGRNLVASSPAFTPSSGDPYTAFQKDQGTRGTWLAGTLDESGGTVVQLGDDFAAQQMVVTRGTVSLAVEDVLPYLPDPPLFQRRLWTFATNREVVLANAIISHYPYLRDRYETNDPHLSISADGRTVVALSALPDELFVVVKYDDTTDPDNPVFVETRVGLPTEVLAQLDTFRTNPDITQTNVDLGDWGWLEHAGLSGDGNITECFFGGAESYPNRRIRVVPVVHPFSASKLFVGYQFGHVNTSTLIADNGTAQLYEDDVSFYAGVYEYDVSTEVWTQLVNKDLDLTTSVMSTGGFFYNTGPDAVEADTVNRAVPQPVYSILLLHNDGEYSIATKISGLDTTTVNHYTGYLNGDPPADDYDYYEGQPDTLVDTSDVTVDGTTWYTDVVEFPLGYNWSPHLDGNFPLLVATDYALVYSYLLPDHVYTYRKLTLAEGETEDDRFVTGDPGMLSPTGLWQYNGADGVLYLGELVWELSDHLDDFLSEPDPSYTAHIQAVSADRDGYFVVLFRDADVNPDREFIFKVKRTVDPDTQAVAYTTSDKREVPLTVSVAPAVAGGDEVTAQQLADNIATDLNYVDLADMCASTGQSEAEWLAAAEAFLLDDTDTALAVLYVDASVFTNFGGDEEAFLLDYYGEGGHTVDEVYPDYVATLVTMVTSLGGGSEALRWTVSFILPDECLSSH